METSIEGPGAKEQKGLSKVWRRLSTTFRCKPSTSSTSQSAAEPESRSQEQARTAQRPVQLPQEYVAKQSLTSDTHDCRRTSFRPENATSTTHAIDEAVAADPTIEHTVSSASVPSQTTTMAPIHTDVDKRVLKARDSMIQAGIELDGAELIIPQPIRNRVPYERVHKRIRMRVRYTCHNCSTIYGHDRICVSCDHPRCTQCPRYPARRNQRHRDTKRAEAVEAAIRAEDKENSEPKFCDCHECQTVVEIGSEECPNCHHRICERCLTEGQFTVSGDQSTAVDTTTRSPEVEVSGFTSPPPGTTTAS